MSQEIYLGNSPLIINKRKIDGNYVDRNGIPYYKISNYDKMRPFFMSVVSHSDHWLFISSTGGISAGRRNEDHALFPYYTDDKIQQSSETTGSKTIIKVTRENKTWLWEPFSNRYQGIYDIQRNLYKNDLGNELIFEEVNLSLGLTFSYGWTFSEKYGFVKQCLLRNDSVDNIDISLLDGLQNILPAGIDSGIQNRVSNLVNAYKKNELDKASGLGMFMLSATIVDKAEPSEALATNVVWSAGLKVENYLLSNLQLEAFRRGEVLQTEVDVRAEAGAYFVQSGFSLAPGEESQWSMGGDVDYSYADVVALQKQLNDKRHFAESLQQDIQSGYSQLNFKLALADGLQCTNDVLFTNRHLSNVLFNIMRGGLFEDQYQIDKSDLKAFIETFSKEISNQTVAFIDSLPRDLNYPILMEKLEHESNADLKRIVSEYLPISFSRRHGDPSRPWNRFSIDLKDENGNVSRKYAGNWRDIFQNWEALAFSIPGYITAMIARFVNASTVDGYNPYRITREGIDWEIVEPDDPWSYIGYWGDHQIIYLQKLLEIAKNHFPEKIKFLLTNEQYVYANVPYKIKGYADLVADPQDTIIYDHSLEAVISERVAAVGSDGKLVWNQNNRPLQANLLEKLMVMLLAKVSNFIPDAGIWLNTQRPEWNDANNALVGNGVSMVTLYYMRRHVSFMIDLIDQAEWSNVLLHEEVVMLFEEVSNCLITHQTKLNKTFSDTERRVFVDAMGRAGESYRSKVYSGFSEKKESLKKEDFSTFLKILLEYIDATTRTNKRTDNLYHAYNIVAFSEDGLTINRLYPMLEGQVGVLSAGLLNAQESLEVLDALKESDIYREDQYSYMLYPDRNLPRFLEKNIIPESFIKNSALAEALLADGNQQLINKDMNGAYHFNGRFNNNRQLKEVLKALKGVSSYSHLVEKEYNDWLNTYEEMFDHKSFTGRSGTFYGYEGLGSIYWHMVSKLLLAVQENIQSAVEEGASAQLIGHLINHYYEIRAGIGINKSPELYGAFPTDPYSHTPGQKGAQQPGMTGQVKEDIISRWAELGVIVRNGELRFYPTFLNHQEWLTSPKDFQYRGLDGASKRIELKENQLAFTYCQVPVVYQKADKWGMTIHLDNNTEQEQVDTTLPRDMTSELFNRTGRITQLVVHVVA